MVEISIRIGEYYTICRTNQKFTLLLFRWVNYLSSILVSLGISRGASVILKVVDLYSCGESYSKSIAYRSSS